MTDTAIRVENLSKRYRIGGPKESYGMLRDVLVSMARAPLRALQNRSYRSGMQEFWALQDVSFEIKRGELLGIIGRNGAGKSTLLKILARITEPTRGRIVIHGRVGSLLEVGTGFHPELTGRENIYLNGAILGMQRTEIDSKFDAIVEFAEIEQFLDTPVKRYSSGMYMRLAFSIAAHLEPEILLVDEVLAVGDVAFQKKCLGKMGDVTREGRTVLFVSHNMDAIQRLCPQCILFERGQLAAWGDTQSVVSRYLSRNSMTPPPNRWIDVTHVERQGTGNARFVAIQYSSLDQTADFLPYSNGSLAFQLMIESDKARSVKSLAVIIYSQSGFKLVNADTVSLGQPVSLRKGCTGFRLKIDRLYLNPGTYTIGLWLADPITDTCFDFAPSAFDIEVIDPQSKGLGMKPPFDGTVMCNFELTEVA